MSLELAILGFLNYKPFSGYDLKKMFDKSVSHFWKADQSQIYRTLARLTEDDFATFEVVEQSERPDRKVYSITPAGREKLNQWLIPPFDGGEVHNPVLLNTFFLGNISDAEVLVKFEDAARQIKLMLEAYRMVPGDILDYLQLIKSPRDAFFWTLTLEYGIKTGQVQLEWVESIIERIQNKQVPESK